MQQERDQERDHELVSFFSSYLTGLRLGLDALSAAGLQIYQRDGCRWFWRWGGHQSACGLSGLGDCIEDAVMTRFGITVEESGMAIESGDEDVM